MKKEIKINVFEFDIAWLDANANIATIENHVKSLGEKVNLVVLPEMYLSGFCMEASKASVAENGIEIEAMIGLARTYQTAFFGSVAIEDEGKYYNRMLLIGEGGIMGRYDKIRRFSPSGENESFEVKYEVDLIPFEGWNLLPQVCYDLRFPENIRPLPAPDLLIYSANWPTPRIHHWEALLKARAIENLCFTIGCNRLGVDDNGWVFPGHSSITGPNGKQVSEGEFSATRVYELSLDTVRDYRAKYRFLEDK